MHDGTQKAHSKNQPYEPDKYSKTSRAIRKDCYKPQNLRQQDGDNMTKYTCLLTRIAAHVQTMSPNRTAKILQTHRASHELNGTPLEIFQKGGSHE